MPDRYLINRMASSRLALHPVAQSYHHWSYAMTDDQEVTDDLPNPARVPPELERLIASLPEQTCFTDDTSGVRIEYICGRWYVCQPGQPAQPISLRLRPRTPRSAA
jgi:hypothetical protein